MLPLPGLDLGNAADLGALHHHFPLEGRFAGMAQFPLPELPVQIICQTAVYGISVIVPQVLRC